MRADRLISLVLLLLRQHRSAVHDDAVARELEVSTRTVLWQFTTNAEALALQWLCSSLRNRAALAADTAGSACAKRTVCTPTASPPSISNDA